MKDFLIFIKYYHPHVIRKWPLSGFFLYWRMGLFSSLRLPDSLADEKNTQIERLNGI
jgi:hypothetical protein